MPSGDPQWFEVNIHEAKNASFAAARARCCGRGNHNCAGREADRPSCAFSHAERQAAAGDRQGRYAIPDDFDAPLPTICWRHSRASREDPDRHRLLALEPCRSRAPEQDGQGFVVRSCSRPLLVSRKFLGDCHQVALGKLRLPEPPGKYIPGRMAVLGILGCRWNMRMR